MKTLLRTSSAQTSSRQANGWVGDTHSEKSWTVIGIWSITGSLKNSVSCPIIAKGTFSSRTILYIASELSSSIKRNDFALSPTPSNNSGRKRLPIVGK